MHQFLIFFSWYCKIIINIFIELENIHGKMCIMWVCNSKKIHKVILPCFIWFSMQLIGILIKHLPCDLKYAQSVKAMAPHSSTLAWKIPWAEEPGRLQSMGSHRVGHDWSDLAAAGVEMALQSCLNKTRWSGLGTLTSSHWVHMAFSFKFNGDVFCSLIDYYLIE